MSRDQDVIGALQRRIKVLERYVVLMMRPSGASWNPDHGLCLPQQRDNNKINAMIMGDTEWDPESLDQGG